MEKVQPSQSGSKIRDYSRTLLGSTRLIAEITEIVSVTSVIRPVDQREVLEESLISDSGLTSLLSVISVIGRQDFSEPAQY